MVLENIRRLGFWTLDFLRGQRIRRHIREFDQYFSNPQSYEILVEDRLKQLLEHAVQTTEYYRNYRGKISLCQFPIIQKQFIRKNSSAFLSNAYDLESLTAVSTSGSYGTPMKFYLTEEKRIRRLAEIIYFNGWAGYLVGKRHAYINVSQQKNPLTLFLQNEVLMDPTHLDIEWFAKQRQRLIKEKIKIVITYPSVLGALAEYCCVQGDHPNDFDLEGIITVSETLYDSLREKIEKVFGCPVLSRYSTMEFGVLAQECPEKQEHHLNGASYIIEILDLEEDRPVNPGELGRVIVTDLFSHGLPLIRYDTGDLAILSQECSCGLKVPSLKRIEGRQVESVYDTQGNRVPPFAISASLKNIEGLIQFQFIQKDAKEYLIKICTLSGFNVVELIRNKLMEILGKDSNIIVDKVKTIPPLKSGKRPYIISQYNKGDIK